MKKMKEKIKNGERIVFCEQMGMMLKSGISVAEGIVILKEDAIREGDPLQEIYKAIQAQLEETGIFYDAIEETEAFPEYMIQMIRIGEQTGNLDEVMFGLAEYYRREEAMVQDLKSAVTYPLLMLGMMLVILLVIIVKVLPVFSQIYAQLGTQMNGMAAALLKIGMGVRTYYGWILLVLFLIAGWCVWLFRSATGKTVFRKFARRFFMTTQIMKKMQTARFAAGMSMALHSGMDYESSFAMVESVMEEGDKTKEIFRQCVEQIKEGESLSQTVMQAGIVTGFYGRMLYIAERTGNTDEALAKIASQADEEITMKIQNVVSILEPTLVAVLSILVGGVLLSVMVPLMGILSSIG